MHYHLLLTEKCNSQCSYCYEKSFKEFDNQLDKKFKFDFSEPISSEVDIGKLKDFLAKDKEAVLIFYGGEPLLEIDKLKEIIKGINVPFRMQTNGKLLNQLPINYLKKIDKILVSIDGNRERTEKNKGQGTYDLVTSNLRQIREKGYSGELIARMTLSPEANAYDIKEQVQHLLSLGIFNSIHWQIDAGFYKFDFNKEVFENFTKKYNKSITELIDYWISEMQKKGKVLMLYPFVAITQDLLKNTKTKLRCGAGHQGYAITTSGKIVACPIMNSIKDFEAGNLSSNPKELKKFYVSGDCLACNYLNLCGGRCLYSNKAELWPKEGRVLICKTIKHMIDSLRARIPEIKELIKQRKIEENEFIYEKYFGPEIIP